MPAGKTPILQSDLMAEGDTNKHILFNDALVRLEDAANRTMYVNASIAHVNLSAVDVTRYAHFLVHSHLEPRFLTIPKEVATGVPTNRVLYVRNAEAHPVTVGHPTGLAVVVNGQESKIIICDGSDVYAVGSAPTANPTLAVKDEGVTVGATVSDINFIGSGVTVGSTGEGQVTVNIPGSTGGGGGGGVALQDNYTPVMAAATTLNFGGTGVSVYDNGDGSADIWFSPPSAGDQNEPLVPAEITADYWVTSQDFADDAGRPVIHRVNSASAVTITVPTGLYTTIPCTFIRTGAGPVTFSANSGATIRSADGKLGLRSQYSSATLIPVGFNVYYLVGDIA